MIKELLPAEYIRDGRVYYWIYRGRFEFWFCSVDKAEFFNPPKGGFIIPKSRKIHAKFIRRKIDAKRN